MHHEITETSDRSEFYSELWTINTLEREIRRHKCEERAIALQSTVTWVGIPDWYFFGKQLQPNLILWEKRKVKRSKQTETAPWVLYFLSCSCSPVQGHKNFSPTGFMKWHSNSMPLNNTFATSPCPVKCHFRHQIDQPFTAVFTGSKMFTCCR